MADPRAPSEAEVREMVRRIVEATLDGGAQASHAPATPPGVAPAATPAAAPAATPAAAPAAPPAVAPAATPAVAPAATPAGARSAIAVAIGADHGGWQLKDTIGRVLGETGYQIRDCGTNGPDAVDYPDIAHAVARLVGDGTCRWGIIVDGAGLGSCMVANKVPGVRAALCHDLSSARNSREHNHANVLTLGARFIGEGLAIEIVRAWLGTDWAPGRHAARVDKIMDVERRYMKATGEGRPG